MIRQAAIQALHEPYAHLYVGDYFADTLDLSAHEHCALRLLLLETWVRGPVGNARLASVARLTKEEWGYQTGSLAFAAQRAAENSGEPQLYTDLRRTTASVSRLAHRSQHRHGAR